MREKTTKPNIISLRLTDEEMENIQQIMELTNKRASNLMRDALALFKAEWEISSTGGTALKN